MNESLVMENENLVHFTVRKYFGAWFCFDTRGDHIVSYDELVQEGMLALVRCANGYKEDLGVKFSTYAVKSIRREIWRWLHNSGRPGLKYPDPASVKSESLRRRIRNPVPCFHFSQLRREDGRLSDVIEARPTKDAYARKEWLSHLLGSYCHPAQVKVLEERFLTEKPKTLRALAAELGTNHEEIRQLEKSAIVQMRTRTTVVPDQFPEAQKVVTGTKEGIKYTMRWWEEAWNGNGNGVSAPTKTCGKCGEEFRKLYLIPGDLEVCRRCRRSNSIRSRILKEHSRMRRSFWRSDGLCTNCGLGRAPGILTCRRCADRSNRASKKYKQRKRALAENA